MNDEQIAQQWMDQCCATIEQYDHKAHMNLISEDVKVFGVPGFDVIGYADWYAQCEYEFNEKLIRQASYQGLKIRQSNEDQVMFLANETIEATDGTVDTHSIEVVLTKEQDGHWRVTQERLLSKEEATHLGIVE
jgi:ketosteroid isomerase-like protein